MTRAEVRRRIEEARFSEKSVELRAAAVFRAQRDAWGQTRRADRHAVLSPRKA